jgi:hypothetical protein
MQHDVATVWLAVLAIYMIDFSINAGMDLHLLIRRRL